MTYNFRISTNYLHLEIIKKYNIRFVLCVCAQSCLTLCDPMDFSVHGIFQARILEWVSISYSRGSSRPRDRTHVSCVSCFGRCVLYHCATWEAPSGTVLFSLVTSPLLSQRPAQCSPNTQLVFINA